MKNLQYQTIHFNPYHIVVFPLFSGEILSITMEHTCERDFELHSNESVGMVLLIRSV